MPRIRPQVLMKTSCRSGTSFKFSFWKICPDYLSAGKKNIHNEVKNIILHGEGNNFYGRKLYSSKYQKMNSER